MRFIVFDFKTIDESNFEIIYKIFSQLVEIKIYASLHNEINIRYSNHIQRDYKRYYQYQKKKLHPYIRKSSVNTKK